MISSFYQILILLTGSVLRAECTFEDYYQMVIDNVAAASIYVLPTSNEEAVKTTDENRYYYGLFDFIIIGAGTAGTVLANRLSEIENWNVLLLEAGGEETEFSDIPGMTGYLQFSTMNWGYNSTPQTTGCLGMINNSCEAPRGRVLGGSSTINGHMYVRGNKEDYDTWVEMGNEGWSYDEVRPYFIQMENSHIYNAEENYHGFSGELDVNYTEPSIFTEIHMSGMQELGFKIVDYNGESQIGTSPIQFLLRGIKNLGGGRAFIDPIKKARINLNITLNAFVTKILIDGERNIACGVEFIKKGKLYVASVTKEVIISAGTLNTPQILMLSGIGPQEDLKQHGINTFLDLPVGQNMEDHPMFMALIFKTNQTAYKQPLRTWLKDYLQGHKPLTDCNFLETTSFLNVFRENDPHPNIQIITNAAPGFHHSILRFRDDIKEEFSKNYNPHSDIHQLIVLIQPKSKGNVTLKSRNAADFPQVNYNYFSDPDGQDIETMYQGILKAIALLDTKAYKSVNASLAYVFSSCDESEEFSREFWYCAIRHFSSTIFHPVGTARMGKSPKDSVVSSDLLVHGTKNLRVVDASVIPKITAGNTVAPTFMIGNKISDIIKKTYILGKLNTEWHMYCNGKLSMC